MHTRVCTPARGRMHRCIREHASMHRRVCTPARRRMHLYIEAYAHPLQGASTCTCTVLAHRPGGALVVNPGYAGPPGCALGPNQRGSCAWGWGAGPPHHPVAPALHPAPWRSARRCAPWAGRPAARSCSPCSAIRPPCGPIVFATILAASGNTAPCCHP